MTDADPTAAGPPPGLPPWITHEVQQRIAWRDGDIVISVPIKSGTTWMMNIVHQLRAGGDPDLEQVYVEVPWLELFPAPDASIPDLVRAIDTMPDHRRRAFKTHSAPPDVPFHAPGSGTDVQYVVVLRNPEEALVSMWPFIGKHTDAWFALWGMPREGLFKPDFATFYHEVASGMGDGVFGFLAAWWPLRHHDNVLLVHFNDLKRDHEGSIRRIADFLGFTPSADQWAGILEYTSFPWMKAHQEKFEAGNITEVPVLETGAMIRKGQAGAARDDGMTDAIAASIRARGEEIVQDAEALRWLYHGGAENT